MSTNKNRRYGIDWSDPAYPEIVLWEHGPMDSEPLTLTEAKDEILETLRERVRSIHEHIGHVKNLRRSDFPFVKGKK